MLSILLVMSRGPGRSPEPPAWLVAQWAFEDEVWDGQWPGRLPRRERDDANPGSADAVLRVDPAALEADEQIDQLVALERLKARVDAAQVRLLAAMDAADETEEHFLGEDVRLALRLSRGAAQARIANARLLVGSLPATLAALESGAISVRHVDAMCEAAERLEAPARPQLESMVLDRAATQTGAELTRTLNRAVLEVDPDGGERRHRRAHCERSVYRYGEADGMASLVLRGAATDIATVYERLDAVTRLLPSDDPRSANEKRADLFVDAMLAGLPRDGLPQRHGRAPSAEVVIALSTLLGFDDEPGDLAGYGAIPAGLARDLATAQDCTWRRLVTDPVTGDLLDYGCSTYRPPADLRDFVVARDGACVAPGYSLPARSCDLDHVQPWDELGPTAPANLAPLCGRDHDAKKKRHLSYERDPDGGFTWVTRTGHRYRTRPPDRWTRPNDASCVPVGAG